MTTRTLTEVFQREYVATHGDLDAAVAAVATSVRAQLDRLPTPTAAPVEVRVVVVHEYRPGPADADAGPSSSFIARVLTLAARQFNVDARRVFSRFARRSKFDVYARWTAAAVLRERGMSLPACGRAVGLRDHTSVIYALKQVEARPDLQAAVARVRDELAPPPAALAPARITKTTSIEVEAA